MKAVLLTGHGGLDMLQWQGHQSEPSPARDEVLIRVAASSINNTDINTRTGWYSGGAGPLGAEPGAGGWGGSPVRFPRIQGTDIVGRIIAVGEDVDKGRIGERVLVQPCLVSRAENGVSPWIGSEVDGGFAEFAVAPSADTHAVDWGLSDFELAALPCAYGTAANMLEQAGIAENDRVLVSGASGNVGIAAILLARLAGAQVHAVASPEKWDALSALGASACHPRDIADMPSGAGHFDIILDLVGGASFPSLLDRLRPNGRMVISGAVAGHAATIDLRKLYLNNWTILGRTQQSRSSFLKLVDQVNSGRLHPPIHRIYPLAQVAEAQTEFLTRRQVGKIVIDVTA